MALGTLKQRRISSTCRAVGKGAILRTVGACQTFSTALCFEKLNVFSGYVNKLHETLIVSVPGNSLNAPQTERLCLPPTRFQHNAFTLTSRTFLLGIPEHQQSQCAHDFLIQAVSAPQHAHLPAPPHPHPQQKFAVDYFQFWLWVSKYILAECTECLENPNACFVC